MRCKQKFNKMNENNLAVKTPFWSFMPIHYKITKNSGIHKMKTSFFLELLADLITSKEIRKLL